MATLILLGSLLRVGLTEATQLPQSVSGVMPPYIEIQEALAIDSTAGVFRAAGDIKKQAARMGSPGRELLAASKAIASATDLRSMRLAFGALSDAVIQLGDATQWRAGTNVAVMFCPMANRHWAQKIGAVANPYFGSKMRTCGVARTRVAK